MEFAQDTLAFRTVSEVGSLFSLSFEKYVEVVPETQMVSKLAKVSRDPTFTDKGKSSSSSR